MISPTTEGTNAVLPGMSRRSVHLCCEPGGQKQCVRQDIGVAAPVSIYVNTFGTGVLPDEEIQAAVSEVFDFTPRGIIRELELRKPVFAATAAYGHFGRPNTEFSWERTNKVSALKKALIATVKAK